MPLGGWDGMLEQLEIRVTTDHVGRAVVSAAAARRLLATVRRQGEKFAEDRQRRSEEMARKHPVPLRAGLPMVEGASPWESVLAAGGVVSPQDEFGGRPKPRFLQEELAEGERAIAEKKREAEAKAKHRLAKQMKDKLR